MKTMQIALATLVAGLCVVGTLADLAELGFKETTLPLLPEEKWWGGAGGDGQNQPYGATSSTRMMDLRVHGNTSAPLLVSSRGRFVWCERPFAYQFTNGVLRLHVRESASLEVEKPGETLREAYLALAARHLRFDGKLPPEIFFSKPQWNNWIEIFLCGMNQKSADDYARELAESGFPCGVYMMDGGWPTHQGAYEFYAKDFPDPKGMFARIRSHGWIPLIWTAHFVSPDSREYKCLRYHKKLNGLDYLAYRAKPGSKEAGVVRWWSGISAIYDLTKPDARDYYVKTLRDFAAAYGIAGFKFDAGDPKMFAEDIRFFDEEAEGVDYTRLYAELAAQEFPYHEIRVSWKCGGLPLVTRLPDRAHSWASQRTIIPQIIAAGLLGCPYSVADMVGGGMEVSFVGVPLDEKLVLRSAALHALMPMMQFSLAPWRRLSPDGVKVCRQFATLHEAFAPYILACAREASRTGAPIVRAMEYEFPNERFVQSRSQFMLGKRYLVAPVMNADDSTVVELPPGTWTDDLGTSYEGPQTLELRDVPISRLPRFERAPAPLICENEED